MPSLERMHGGGVAVLRRRQPTRADSPEVLQTAVMRGELLLKTRPSQLRFGCSRREALYHAAKLSVEVAKCAKRINEIRR